MHKKSALEFIDQELPFEIRQRFPAAIHKAYGVAETLFSSVDYLSGSIGRDCLPYIKNVAVQFFMQRIASESGLQVKQRKNAAGNHHHIEIHTGCAALLISQVKNKDAVPRDAHFRRNENGYRSPQTSLLSAFGHSEYEVRDFDKPILLLTHGYRSIKPSFVELGMPNGNSEWIDSYSLLDKPYIVYDEAFREDTVDVDDSELVSLIEEISSTRKNQEGGDL